MNRPSRRDLLKSLTTAGLSIMAGCASLPRYHARRRGRYLFVPERILIPATGARPSPFVSVTTDTIAAPIFLGSSDGKRFIAVLGLCTHRRCHLSATPYAFECPCHGSRFALDGQVLQGPAARSLTRLPVRRTRKPAGFEIDLERSVRG